MGDVVTTKSDVYSFAMILWELLTSSIPFKEFLYGPGASDRPLSQMNMNVDRRNTRNTR